MDTSENNANGSLSSPTSSNLTAFGVQFTPLRFFQSPVSTLLEYSGLFTVRPDNPEMDPLVVDDTVTNEAESSSNVGGGNSSSGEVSIRIIGAGENQGIGGEDEDDGSVMDGEEGGAVEERGSGVDASSMVADDDAGNASRDSSYQRFDIQQVARWIEQILPFSLLLLFVFIRQHLQGTFSFPLSKKLWLSAICVIYNI